MNIDKNKMPEIVNVVERNVNALLDRRKEDIKSRTSTEKMVDLITTFAGSMASFYFHSILFGIWIFWNLGWLNLKPFDHNFIYLATFAAVEAIFLTTFVLMGQKRMNVQREKSAELGLQISLLTEHEVTRVMNIVKAIANKMDIKEANNKEIEELSKDIHPDSVLDAIENAAK